MYGAGYDWAQQYSVSSGDFVGSLPVGMQSRGDADVPYWPSQNMYVYKEVWVHPASRWLWLMADLLDPVSRAVPRTPVSFSVTTTPAPNGGVMIRLTAAGEGSHTFALRAENLVVERPTRLVTFQGGRPTTIEWNARRATPDAPSVAVVVPDGDVSRRHEVMLEH